MTPIEILLVRAPCYKASAQVLALISLAESATSSCGWGTNRTSAVALLALHYLAIGERGAGGAAGAITSESEGDLSRSYASPQSNLNDYDFGSTIWGMELLRLRRSCFFGVITRMSRGVGGALG